MFGLNNEETALIEARLVWLTACAVIVMQAIGKLLHLPFPPPPGDPAANLGRDENN